MKEHYDVSIEGIGHWRILSNLKEKQFTELFVDFLLNHERWMRILREARKLDLYIKK